MLLLGKSGQHILQGGTMNEKEILVVLSEYSDGPFDLATVFNIAFNLGML